VRQTFVALAEADPDRYLVVDARLTPDEIAAVIRVRIAELLSGLPLQQIVQPEAAPDVNGVPVADELQGPATPHHPHAQTGATPHLHP
jgi:dTMP kinase